MQKELEMKLITLILFRGNRRLRSNSGVADARDRRRKIADELRAGPVFVTKDAALLD
jgi:hypothetical protein